MSAPAATRFGPFELLEPLGGGMGIVYRARRDGAEHEVALKLLRHERLLDGEARARFARELRALQRLSHPGICPVLASGEVDGMPYLCMPLLPGRTLASHIKVAREAGDGAHMDLPPGGDASPDWRRIATMLAAVADAVQAAHDLGLVHRDLKPGNVMIAPSGEPVLLDFGLAGDDADRYRHLTRTGQVIGTPAYMAPEQLDARLGPVSHQVDVYSLGAVFYEALTLHAPYAGDTRAELFDRILSGPPVDPRRYRKDLPAAVVQLLDVAMARNPRRRHASAAALAADLRRLVAGEPLRVRGPAWPRRLLDRLQQRRLEVLLAAVAGALAVLLGATFTRSGTAGRDAAEVVQGTWLGRVELAQRSYAALPPPWPPGADALAQWLEKHGEPLLRAPAEAWVLSTASWSRTAFERAVLDVRRRVAFAAEVGVRSIADHEQRWAACREAMAVDGRFAGIRLEPLPGLVPLGPDPGSGLPEFYDLASGDPELPIPERSPEDGRLLLAPRHGIVLVLLPGGLHRLGEGAGSVPLDPFFIGKHELTRAQHVRLSGGLDPSRWPLGVPLLRGEAQSERHPVDSVLCGELQELLARWGLQLPTEVQWEYAAGFGREAAGPMGAETTGSGLSGNVRGGEDGFQIASPVGSFDANRAGLHDLFGNVAEFCADALSSTGHPPRPGDGLRLRAEGQMQRVVRGGSFSSDLVPLAYRGQVEADQRREHHGARAVRRLPLR